MNCVLGEAFEGPDNASKLHTGHDTYKECRAIKESKLRRLKFKPSTELEESVLADSEAAVPALSAEPDRDGAGELITLIRSCYRARVSGCDARKDYRPCSDCRASPSVA